MAVSGKNGSIKWKTVVYDADDCIQSGSLERAMQEIVVQCGGVNQALDGPIDVTATISMYLDADDVAKVNDFDVQETGALELHPAGDTPTYIEIISTSAKITSSPITWSVNGALTMDVTWRLSDVTYQAASS